MGKETMRKVLGGGKSPVNQRVGFEEDLFSCIDLYVSLAYTCAEM